MKTASHRLANDCPDDDIPRASPGMIHDARSPGALMETNGALSEGKGPNEVVSLLDHGTLWSLDDLGAFFRLPGEFARLLAEEPRFPPPVRIMTKEGAYIERWFMEDVVAFAANPGFFDAP